MPPRHGGDGRVLEEGVPVVKGYWLVMSTIRAHPTVDHRSPLFVIDLMKPPRSFAHRVRCHTSVRIA
jgi:hypothetical protein